MSFRVSALVAGAVVLELAAFSPVSAQPQVPVRPQYSQFNSIFRPNTPQIMPGRGGAQVGIGPQVPGLVYPGMQLPGGAYPQGGGDPTLPPTGVAASFNNLGHWYGGNLGHWYQNGVANGRGVLGYAAGNGVLGSGGGGGMPAAGGGAMMSRPSVLGSAALGAATFGAIRR